MTFIDDLLHDHRSKVSRELLQEARKLFVATVVGLFGSLAYLKMVEDFLSFLQAQSSMAREGSEFTNDWILQIALVLSFSFISLAFMAGTMTYLVAVRPTGKQRFWVWDLFFTSLTLSIIVFLGSCCKFETARYFQWSMFALFAVQIPWGFMHSKAVWNNGVPYGWFVVNPAAALVCGLSAWYLTTIAAAYVIAGLSMLIFLYDFFIIGAREGPAQTTQELAMDIEHLLRQQDQIADEIKALQEANSNRSAALTDRGNDVQKSSQLLAEASQAIDEMKKAKPGVDNVKEKLRRS